MTLLSVADRPGIATTIFGPPVSDAGVNVDMIVQNISEEGRTDMTFSLPDRSGGPAPKRRWRRPSRNGGLKLNFSRTGRRSRTSAKVSVVGIGMRSQSGVAAKMFKVLSR